MIQPSSDTSGYTGTHGQDNPLSAEQLLGPTDDQEHRVLSYNPPASELSGSTKQLQPKSLTESNASTGPLARRVTAEKMEKEL